ncbi:AAA family ATPase [Aliarcobacter butzleri]|uniref:ATP-dependent nuclease n=1 Tax=Aliarcobacter butzleri TaxID=28197 RepID=UPI00263C6952|nr:ATP-binding protein [Aliarcobacter butzleri]MDN5046636.1 AAA family ATPase [Aliarcobacter butzleri]
MKLKSLKIKGFKNLTGTDGWFNLDFTNKNGITVLIGNNGSGKSNILEAISSIFIGLYKIGTPQRKPTFSYVIEYSIGEEPSTDIKIELIDGTYGFYINDTKELKKDFIESGNRWLPSRVIASYSGEELRLWDTYYKHSYSDFITSVKNNELRSLPEQKLFYIDSDYWNEALIVFLLSELENNKNFVANNLGIVSVGNIVFTFNTNNLSKYQSNMITEFVRRLNPDNNNTITKSFEDFKDFVTEYEYGLFIKLISASQSELITNITINFNTNLTTEDLSEGQKKQILIRAILEFLADQKTLVLLDEPDSHIHVANKLQLKKMLEEYEYKNLIFTSHSPTLMNIFENHLEHLENGQIKGSEKAEILKEISGDTMSDAQRQILLNANTDILIVEGKTDEKYISTALEKLKQDNSQYEDLEFNYLYMGGSDPENLKKLVEQFPPKDNQTIIAFFDNDGAGYSCITKAFSCRTQKQDFTKINENGVHICLYPKKDGFIKSDFEIEDYFKIETCRDFMFNSFETFQDTKKKFKKDDFAEYCPTLGTDEFNGFKKLFDLILEIKSL